MRDRDLKGHLSHWQTSARLWLWPLPLFIPKLQLQLQLQLLFSHSSFVHLAIRNEFFLRLRLRLSRSPVLFAVLQPSSWLSSIPVNWHLSNDFGCPSTVASFSPFSKRHVTIRIPSQLALSLTSCQIFWHIIWICANLELPFPAGHLSGPNALHDKRKRRPCSGSGSGSCSCCRWIYAPDD